jgi:hypothetical protein
MDDEEREAGEGHSPPPESPGENEEQARQKRTRRLREDILEADRDRPRAKGARRAETPREFIERRMRELDANPTGETDEDTHPS